MVRVFLALQISIALSRKAVRVIDLFHDQNGARRARQHGRRVLGKVGGTIKERRARGSARARRRRVDLCEPARRQAEQQRS